MTLKLRQPEDYYIKLLLQKTKVAEVMISPVISILDDAPFSEVELKLRRHNIRHLPVVDSKEKLVGIVTQRDLYRLVSPRILEDGGWYYDKEMLDTVILKKVMTQSLETVSPKDSVGTVVLKMVRGKYGCLPVVDNDGKLCGILTQLDILKLAAAILME